METNSPTDDQPPEILPEAPIEPASEPPVEDAAEGADGSPAIEDAPPGDLGDVPPSEAQAQLAEASTDELTQLAEASQRARLSPGEEERMNVLLKEALLGGRAGVARAIEVMPKVPWIVGVRAVESTWPELTGGFRTQLLAGLGKDETDAARRMRLSLARALFRLDPAVALKLAIGVVKEMRDKETGALAPKQAQIFANVFIGRARPWLAQLPLGELKPAEGDMLAHCAILAAFTVPHPPVTQLGILKWAQENGRLAKLQETALDAVKKNVSRWSAKWQGALRREVAELPEEIASALKPAGEEPRRERENAPEGREESSELDPEAEPRDPQDFREPREDADEDDDEDEDGDLDEEEKAPLRKERPVYEPRPQKPAAEGQEPRERDGSRERPVYTPRNAGAGGAQRFNLNDAFRQIEGHIQSLRNDLAAAQAKLRNKDDDRRRRPEKGGAIIEGEPTPEELARLNVQLEARNAELQARITEMAQHSEDVATSMGVMSGEPVNDSGAQLRTLLALKLQEDHADFLALEKESNDLVVQQHYKGLIRHVFEVLQQLEVPLKPEQP